MRILVTGAAGFIGSRLVLQLLAQDHTVVAVDNFSERVHGGLATLGKHFNKAKFYPIDIRSRDSMRALLMSEEIDAVVHLASETATGKSLEEIVEHTQSNVCGTATLLAALSDAKSPVRRIVLASSRAVYGEGAWVNDRDEVEYPAPRSAMQLSLGKWIPTSVIDSQPLERPLPHCASSTLTAPVSIYGTTKLAQEGLVRSWSHANDVSSVVLRFQNVYGPGQSTNNPYTGVLTLFCTRASQHQVLDVYEDGNIIRDFVYIDDVVKSLTLAVEAPLERSAILDVGTGVAASLFSVAQRMSEILGAPAPVISGNYRAGDVRTAYADTSASIHWLGWEPLTNLDSGLERLCQFVLSPSKSDNHD